VVAIFPESISGFMNYGQMPTIYNPNPTLTGFGTPPGLKPKTRNNPD
jgi:hypothetical protein